MSFIDTELANIKHELEHELARITHWWSKHTPDESHGGFHAEISLNGETCASTPKALVLNTRILWFFSERAKQTSNPLHIQLADRAYNYLTHYFLDKDHGGFYWSLDVTGAPVDTKKQVYAQGFAIYALSNYFALSGCRAAIDLAIATQDLLETHAWDGDGYLDAFDQQWDELNDSTLGAADENYPKKMNTHLHLLEAYTGLHHVVPSSNTHARLKKVINCYCEHFVDFSNYSLKMFFDKEWNDHSSWQSLGHEIESSWLIHEALELLNCKATTRQHNHIILGIANRCEEIGIGYMGEFRDEYREESDFSRERVWWIQAEALVGFFNAYQYSREQKYFYAFTRIWQFIKCTLIDPEAGEWQWYSSLDRDDTSPYLAGPWKGPYHNGRALMQCIKRINEILKPELGKNINSLKPLHRNDTAQPTTYR